MICLLVFQYLSMLVKDDEEDEECLDFVCCQSETISSCLIKMVVVKDD